MSRVSLVQKGHAVLALLLLAACEQVRGPVADYRPGEAGTIDHALCLLGFSAIPVQAVAPGHHLIEATVNGQTGNFVLDTGANVTVIDAPQAERFGLSSDGGGLRAGRNLSVGASGNARQLAISSFEIGPISVRQRRIVTAELGHLLTALGTASGQEVAGIVGQDVLNEHRAIIDVARPMLYLMDDDREPGPVPADRCQTADRAATNGQDHGSGSRAREKLAAANVPDPELANLAGHHARSTATLGKIVVAAWVFEQPENQVQHSSPPGLHSLDMRLYRKQSLNGV